MPISIPEIDLARIRPYGQPASRTNAFEELSSILIEQRDEWPSGTRFHRFGNPDGGREGKGVLPNGDVWACQAKFLFAFDPAAAGQVKKSLVRTLESRPKPSQQPLIPFQLFDLCLSHFLRSLVGLRNGETRSRWTTGHVADPAANASLLWPQA